MPRRSKKLLSASILAKVKEQLHGPKFNERDNQVRLWLFECKLGRMYGDEYHMMHHWQWWERTYDLLNELYFDNQLKPLDINCYEDLGNRGTWMGRYCHNDVGGLSERMEFRPYMYEHITPIEWTGILLHEMCHQFVRYKYGHQRKKHSGNKYRIVNVSGHGPEWLREMEKVGFNQPTKYSGETRFTTNDPGPKVNKKHNWITKGSECDKNWTERLQKQRIIRRTA